MDIPVSTYQPDLTTTPKVGTQNPKPSQAPNNEGPAWTVALSDEALASAETQETPSAASETSAPEPIFQVITIGGDTISLHAFETDVEPPPSELLPITDQPMEAFLSEESATPRANLEEYVLEYLESDQGQAILQDLGISDLEQMEPEEAATLSSRIVGEHMDYYHEMGAVVGIHPFITDSGELRGRVLFNEYNLEQIKDAAVREKIMRRPEKFLARNNREFKRIDKLSEKNPLRILENGKGICRNYSPVNQDVYNVLKKNYPANLQNSYMLATGSSTKELAHEWNTLATQVSHGEWVFKNIDPTEYDAGMPLGSNDVRIEKATLDGLYRKDVIGFKKNIPAFAIYDPNLYWAR